MLKKILNSPILMTWLKDFVRFGTPVLVVPLVVAFYSETDFNFYFFIPTIIAFAMLADSGLSTITVRAVSYFMAGAEKIPRTKKEFDQADSIEDGSPNHRQLIALFHTTKRIYIGLSLMLVVMLSTVGVFAVKNLISSKTDNYDLWAAYILLIVYSSVLMLNMRWSSFMRGLDYVAQEARFNTIVTGFRILSFMIMLSFKLSPMYLTMGYLAEGLASYIYLRNFVLKWFQKNNLDIKVNKKFDAPIFKSLWSAIWRMAGISWGNFLVEYGNNIIILQIPDLSLMAAFNFTAWILKTIFRFSLTPVYARVPVLYKLAAEKNFNRLKKAAAGYMFLGLSMIFFAYLLIGSAGNPLLEVLGSDKRFLPISLFIIMALTEMLDLHSSFHAGVYCSTNHIPFFFPSIIAGGLIFGIGLGYAMPVYGVVGIIYTRFLIQIGFNNWYAMILNLRFLKWPLHKFILDVPKYGMQFIFSKANEFLVHKK